MLPSIRELEPEVRALLAELPGTARHLRGVGPVVPLDAEAAPAVRLDNLAALLDRAHAAIAGLHGNIRCWGMPPEPAPRPERRAAPPTLAQRAAVPNGTPAPARPRGALAVDLRPPRRDAHRTDGWIDSAGVALLLGRSHNSVWSYVAEGRLPPPDAVKGRVHLWRRESIEPLAALCRAGQRPPVAWPPRRRPKAPR